MSMCTISHVGINVMQLRRSCGHYCEQHFAPQDHRFLPRCILYVFELYVTVIYVFSAALPTYELMPISPGRFYMGRGSTKVTPNDSPGMFEEWKRILTAIKAVA